MKNYGFHPELIEIRPEDYVFGDAQLGGEPINPSADWTPWLPKFEHQATNYETSGCTCFGTLNALEILHKFKYDVEPNYSERYNYNDAEITLAGANPQDACESIRKNGVIYEEVLPMTDTYEEFITPRPVTERYLRDGRFWVANHEYKHDWVLTGRPNVEALKAALCYSPLGVSVTAWFEEDGVYIDRGIPNNHWCTLVKFDGDKPVVFDSYGTGLKTLSADHTILFAKRFHLAKRPDGPHYDEVLKGTGSTLWALIKKLFSWLF